MRSIGIPQKRLVDNQSECKEGLRDARNCQVTIFILWEVKVHIMLSEFDESLKILLRYTLTGIFKGCCVLLSRTHTHVHTYVHSPHPSPTIHTSCKPILIHKSIPHTYIRSLLCLYLNGEGSEGTRNFCFTCLFLLI